jgi:hypothetical protein
MKSGKNWRNKRRRVGGLGSGHTGQCWKSSSRQGVLLEKAQIYPVPVVPPPERLSPPFQQAFHPHHIPSNKMEHPYGWLGSLFKGDDLLAWLFAQRGEEIVTST